MIIGIGTDLADNNRIATVLEKQGQQFLDRCFTETERSVMDDPKRTEESKIGFLAKRWAAKEACAKALGTGIAENVFLKDIGVCNDDRGKPYLELTGGALKRLQDLMPESKQEVIVHLSLSDEPPLSMAFVVIEAR